MKKEEIKIEELSKACDKILGICKEYSFLWDNKFIEGNYLKLCWGWIARDETYSIGIEKLESLEDFVFTGKNFSYGSDVLTGKRAAEELRSYHINADNLTSRFFYALKKPLGNYLAEKKIEKIKKSADFTS